MNYLKHVAATVLVATAILAGCAPTAPAPPAAPQQPAPKPPLPPKVAEPAKPAETPKPVEAPKPPAPPKPVEPPKPAPAPVKLEDLVPVEPNFIANPSLENWEADGTPVSWNMAEGFESTWEPVKVKKVAGAPDAGDSAIELPAPTDENVVVLSQSIADGKIRGNLRLFVSAQVNSQEKESLHLVLTYKDKGETQTVRRVSQGSEGWEKLEAQFWVPVTADLASFRLQFIVQKGVKDAVLVDDVRVQLMAPKDSPAAKRPAPAPAPAPAPEAAAPEAPAKDEAAPAAESKDGEPEAAKEDEKADKKSSEKSDSKKSSSKKSDKKSK